MRNIISLILLIAISSCSRSYMVKTDTTKMVVEQVNVFAVAYRRPDYRPADQDDFTLKNKELDCKLPEELWKDLIQDQGKVEECLNSIENGKATYFYVPDAQPYLEIDPKEETNPKCLLTALPKLPLPREIYYLGRDKEKVLSNDRQECFSSSFSVNTNQVMKTPIGFLKKKISIPFPVDRALKNAHDLSLWLMVTTFTILKGDDKAGGQLLATPVPDSLCRACFKRDALFDDQYSGKIKPVFWP